MWVVASALNCAISYIHLNSHGLQRHQCHWQISVASQLYFEVVWYCRICLLLRYVSKSKHSHSQSWFSTSMIISKNTILQSTKYVFWSSPLYDLHQKVELIQLNLYLTIQKYWQALYKGTVLLARAYTKWSKKHLNRFEWTCFLNVSSHYKCHSVMCILKLQQYSAQPNFLQSTYMSPILYWLHPSRLLCRRSWNSCTNLIVNPNLALQWCIPTLVAMYFLPCN